MRVSDSVRQDRLALVRAYEASNLTKADYCRQHGLSANSFDHWCREAKKEQSPGIVEAAFFQVQVADSPPKVSLREPDLEVELPFGVKLRFFGTGVAK